MIRNATNIPNGRKRKPLLHGICQESEHILGEKIIVSVERRIEAPRLKNRRRHGLRQSPTPGRKLEGGVGLGEDLGFGDDVVGNGVGKSGTK